MFLNKQIIKNSRKQKKINFLKFKKMKKILFKSFKNFLNSKIAKKNQKLPIPVFAVRHPWFFRPNWKIPGFADPSNPLKLLRPGNPSCWSLWLPTNWKWKISSFSWILRSPLMKVLLADRKFHWNLVACRSRRNCPFSREFKFPKKFLI